MPQLPYPQAYTDVPVLDIDLLSGMLPVQERAWLLPGLLSRNRDVTGPLLEHIYKGNNGDCIAEQDLFSELIDLDPGEDEVGTEEDHSWSKDGWYCLNCLKELYKQRYMAWWKQAKAKSVSIFSLLDVQWIERSLLGGAPVQDDCWYVELAGSMMARLLLTESDRYGYNCRTMTHKPYHATKLNVSRISSGNLACSSALTDAIYRCSIFVNPRAAMLREGGN